MLSVQHFKRKFTQYNLIKSLRHSRTNRYNIIEIVVLSIPVFKINSIKFNKNNDHIHVINIDGPLNYMENNWKFVEKGNLTNGYKTEVLFDIDFEVKNKFLNILPEDVLFDCVVTILVNLS